MAGPNRAIERFTRDVTLTIAQSASVATEGGSAFQIKSDAWGSIQVDSSMTSTEITFNVSNDGSNWTACPVVPGESNPTTSVSANQSIDVPVKAYCFKFLQVAGDQSEAAARSIKYFGKG